jgi:hypothetical protein
LAAAWLKSEHARNARTGSRRKPSGEGFSW